MPKIIACCECIITLSKVQMIYKLYVHTTEQLVVLLFKVGV